MKKNPVAHFEMPYQDYQRLSKFYSNVFGWEMQHLGKEMNDYVLATTSETDENRMVKTPGNINGGFFPKGQEGTEPYPSVVIVVDDINQSIKQINESGGKVHGEPQMIPGVGHFVYFTDTEGNRVSVIQSLN